MKPETVMWLLLVMFMIHDFEEIIMMSAWLQKHQGELRQRFSGRFSGIHARLLEPAVNRSPAAFALAVSEIFILLAVLIMVTAEYHLYEVWTGMLLAYFFHLLGHIGQWIAFRRYTPAILTSLLTGVYCLYALWYMDAVVHIQWSAVILPALISVVLLVGNLAIALRLADRFDGWLQRYAHAQERP